VGTLVRAVHREVLRRTPSRARKRLAALFPEAALRWYRGRRADAVLVSFPKCGRTWLRVLIGRAIQQQFGLPEGASLIELHRLAELGPGIPCVFATHDDDAQWKAAADVEADKSAYRDRRVILLVRDPRDVIVSLYHQMRDRRGAYDGALPAFVREPVGGFDSLLRFYDAWAGALDDLDEVLLVRYEDLHADPGAELRRVLAFIGMVGVDDAVIDDAVRYGSFDHMRQLEEGDLLGSEKLRPVRPGDLDTYKTRRGVVGGHRLELSPDDIAFLDDAMADSRVGRFGYGPGAS
jgi:hypothetical protein